MPNEYFGIKLSVPEGGTLVRKNIDAMWEINALFGGDEGPDFGTALLAGEEHPMSIETAEYEDGERLYVSFYIPKGDFEYHIYLFAANAKLEDLTARFAKL